ncbi:LytR C-terminal domain-containing protein [Jannaschia sp. R86511]|uniref:LytR C-terminal domain-containing protein n=1 Tax=Jannaschia sp. R86511 TaxID=3093853 RepID=UPI0036D27AAD
MPDDQPAVPDAGDSGVQRALGERRRRRLAERAGQVDLDATMSHWPVTEPPSTPRPVVRPARPVVDGAATAPVLPQPGQTVVGPLLEARRAGSGADTVAPAGGRRSRRRATAAAPEGPATTGAARVLPGATTGAGQRPAAASGEPAPGAGPLPVDPPAPVDPQAPVTEPAATAQPSGGAQPPAGTTGRPLDRPAPVDPFEPGSSAPAVAPAGTEAPGRRRVATGSPTPVPTPVPEAGRERSAATVLGRRGRAGGGWLTWPPGRRQVVVAVAVVAVVALVVALLVGLLGGDDDAGAAPQADGADAQRTVAMALADAEGVVTSAALLGADADRLSTLLLPGEVLLTVADAGDRTLAQAAVLGPEAVRRGLEDTLLLRVDTAVLLEPQQLATLVDGVGGVVVDVATQVVTDSVVVGAGEDQRLTGAQAVAYAGLQVDGEPPEAALARFGAVLGALVAALPPDAEAAGEALAAASVTAAGEPGTLAPAVAAAAERAAAGSTEAVVLPTTELTAGQADQRGVAEDEAAELLSSRFAGAELPVAAVGEVRVVVRNGVGQEGLVGRARDLLVAAGLRYTGGGNAASFDVADSVVLVASQEQDDREQGEAVARALGLPGDALQVNNEAMVDTDVVVVLGQDFTAATAEDGSTPPTTPGDLP